MAQCVYGTIFVAPSPCILSYTYCPTHLHALYTHMPHLPIDPRTHCPIAPCPELQCSIRPFPHTPTVGPALVND